MGRRKLTEAEEAEKNRLNCRRLTRGSTRRSIASLRLSVAICLRPSRRAQSASPTRRTPELGSTAAALSSVQSVGRRLKRHSRKERQALEPPSGSAHPSLARLIVGQRSTIIKRCARGNLPRG